MHLLVLALAVAAPASPPASLDPAAAGRFAALALACVHQEYPNKVSHVLHSDADARSPRELTPAFCGCYDWHSAVHGHWLLARLARLFPEAPFAAAARAALARSFTADNVTAEVRYLADPGRASFERPYGLAWLLQLAAELRSWNDPAARAWAEVLRPLEAEAAQRLRAWLPKLRYPIRIGEHGQTAFAFGLVWDWARVVGDGEMRALLPVGVVTDRSDPKLAHLDGLNLSRAWMLEGIASGLPASDPRLPALGAAARAHREAALPFVTGEHYEGGHWLGTFAVYLVTGAGH